MFSEDFFQDGYIYIYMNIKLFVLVEETHMVS